MSDRTQINLSYNPVEDRLLLRLSAPSPQGLVEYRMWITRRFTRMMWLALDQVLKDESEANPRVEPRGREMVRRFEEEAALSRADFSTPYEPENPVTPLGPEPMLVVKTHIKKLPDGQRVIIMQDARSRGVNLTVGPALIHSIRKLLSDTADKAGWDLNLDLYSKAPEAGGEAHPRSVN